MSEHDSTCANASFPVQPAIDWLEDSGFYLYRNGCYDVQFDEVRAAYLWFLETGNNRQLDHLDLLRWNCTGGIRSESDVKILEEIERGQSIWCDSLPDDLRDELNQSVAFHAHRKTYKFRRRKANHAISNKELRSRVIARDGGRCRECGDDGDICLDHVIPVVRGGDDSEENLQVLCRVCNSRKGGR